MSDNSNDGPATTDFSMGCIQAIGGHHAYHKHPNTDHGDKNRTFHSGLCVALSKSTGIEASVVAIMATGLLLRMDLDFSGGLT